MQAWQGDQDERRRRRLLLLGAVAAGALLAFPLLYRRWHLNAVADQPQPSPLPPPVSPPPRAGGAGEQDLACDKGRWRC